MCASSPILLTWPVILAAAAITCAVSPVSAQVGAEAVPAQAATNQPPASLDAVAALLKEKADVEMTPRRGFGARAAIAVNLRAWHGQITPIAVLAAAPGDELGKPPVGHMGAAPLRIVATDSRYTVAAGPGYDSLVMDKILTTLGMTATDAAERLRLADSRPNWLDIRLAVVSGAVGEAQPPLPIPDGPTAIELQKYRELFRERGANTGKQLGDAYLWYATTPTCDVPPAVVSQSERDIKLLTIPPTAAAATYVLLSDQSNETLLSGSKRPRPWNLKSATALQDPQGRATVELVFDVTAAAKLARLTEANPDRALAILFNSRVFAIHVIERPLISRLTISGKNIDEPTSHAIARSLRECMIEPADAK